MITRRAYSKRRSATRSRKCVWMCPTADDSRGRQIVGATAAGLAILSSEVVHSPDDPVEVRHRGGERELLTLLEEQ